MCRSSANSLDRENGGGFPEIDDVLPKVDTTAMNHTFSLLDAVALTVDIPDRKLVAGQVGTIVEMLAPDMFEVEFSDDSATLLPTTLR